MRFSHPWWLAGTALALVVAALLVAGAFLLVRAARRFGDEPLVTALVTDRPAGRRALKGVLTVLAVAIGFVALAQPQYGRGTRIIPATNLDVVVVLDYSKSMYAKDVSPSRTERAKSEVSRLIGDLPGARFGAVAFAGEPVSFPLTSDGAAIAQFFRQMSPADMPVGGTAIARALDLGLDLLRRDPVSQRHRRVMVLVTDGEDLEGDPVAVAEAASKEKVTIHVVQIGGRTPEPIPDVDDNGNTRGWRKDASGQPLTTALSAAGEEQLGKIAQVTGGNVVRSERGVTGITEVAESMRRMMTEELTEKVETVYADVYMYPAGLAFLLLLAEAAIPESSARRRRKAAEARPFSAIALLFLLALLAGCDTGPFKRHAPAVDDALKALDAGDPGQATSLLGGYLSTGECKEGEIGSPEAIHTYPNATLDLGLALFRVAEKFGARFGDDGEAKPEDEAQSARRKSEVDCALRVVRAIAGDAQAPLTLRAKAHYLAGNLSFLTKAYRDAVTSYDAALKLTPPAGADTEDALGARAAWNRAIALRRIEDEEKKKADAGKPDEKPDGGQPQHGDGGKPDPQNQGDGGQPQNPDPDKKNGDDQKKDDQGKDPKSEPKDDGQKPEEKPDPSQSKNQPPQPSPSRDERMLDQLEQAPTVQQEAGKRRAARIRGSGMEDK